jgi:hypothetical protein
MLLHEGSASISHLLVIPAQRESKKTFPQDFWRQCSHHVIRMRRHRNTKMRTRQRRFPPCGNFRHHDTGTGNPWCIYSGNSPRGIRSCGCLGIFPEFTVATGATFGALNTMSSAVNARLTESATLRAIGFRAASVVCAVLAEALLLGLIGATVGTTLV